jgi:chromosome segregation ATPase
MSGFVTRPAGESLRELVATLRAVFDAVVAEAERIEESREDIAREIEAARDALQEAESSVSDAEARLREAGSYVEDGLTALDSAEGALGL